MSCKYCGKPIGLTGDDFKQMCFECSDYFNKRLNSDKNPERSVATESAQSSNSLANNVVEVDKEHGEDGVIRYDGGDWILLANYYRETNRLQSQIKSLNQTIEKYKDFIKDYQESAEEEYSKKETQIRELSQTIEAQSKEISELTQKLNFEKDAFEHCFQVSNHALSEKEKEIEELKRGHTLKIPDIDFFINQKRKFCWDSEMENDEYCIPEKAVYNFFLQLSRISPYKKISELEQEIERLREEKEGRALAFAAWLCENDWQPHPKVANAWVKNRLNAELRNHIYSSDLYNQFEAENEQLKSK